METFEGTDSQQLIDIHVKISKGFSRFSQVFVTKNVSSNFQNNENETLSIFLHQMFRKKRFRLFQDHLQLNFY